MSSAFRFAAICFVLPVLCTASAGAFTLQTSARVEIVPGVEILRVGGDLPVPALAPEQGAPAGFHVEGPAERAVRVAWIVDPGDAAASPASSSASRHDETGGLLLEFGSIPDPAPDAGYRLTLEYE